MCLREIITAEQNLIFFVPQTSIIELSSTFYAEFRYVHVFFYLEKFQIYRRIEMCKIVLYVLLKQAETFL